MMEKLPGEVFDLTTIQGRMMGRLLRRLVALGAIAEHDALDLLEEQAVLMTQFRLQSEAEGGPRVYEDLPGRFLAAAQAGFRDRSPGRRGAPSRPPRPR